MNEQIKSTQVKIDRSVIIDNIQYMPTSKLEILSDALRDCGQVFFASILVEPIIAHNASFGLVIMGVALSLFCWVIRLLIVVVNNRKIYE